MKGLRGLFIRKIAITAIFLCLPLLFFPASLFIWCGIPAPEPMIFVRLLGVAYLALLLGYYGGLKSIDSNQIPISAINMGLVSNGGGAMVFVYFGLIGSWSSWGSGARIYMWLLTVGAGMMAYSLFRARGRYMQSNKGS